MWDENTLEMVVIALLVVVRLRIYLVDDGNDGDEFNVWMLASAQPLSSLFYTPTELLGLRTLVDVIFAPSYSSMNFVPSQ